MKIYHLPADYTEMTSTERKEVREQYIREQENKCHYCGCPLDMKPPPLITDHQIDWRLFPPNFLRYPVHLHHHHDTGMTIGSVHAYCNAVSFQYDGV